MMSTALVKAKLEAELKRQHEKSGPYGALHYLSINEEGEAHVEGAIDLAALAHAVGGAFGEVTTMEVDLKAKSYVYECDKGMSIVHARSLEEAQKTALLDSGRSDPPRGVRLATDEDVAWFTSMGGNPNA